MILNYFLPFILSNIYYPIENSTNYINNNVNISWNDIFEEKHINLFLLQD